VILDARRRFARRHAARRAEERFGIVLDHATHRTIRDVISGANNTEGRVLGCLQRTEKGRKVYRMLFRGKVFRLVWDKARRTVVTLLPQDEVDLAEQVAQVAKEATHGS